MNFLDILSKKAQISSLIKIRPVRAELFHEYRRTDGQTDMTKLIVASRNFAHARKNERLLLVKWEPLISGTAIWLHSHDVEAVSGNYIYHLL